MPIFEYKCSDCNSTFELLTKTNGNAEIICPECHSSNNKKLFSAFSTSAGDSSYSSDNCVNGNCSIDNAAVGGCSNGMCGLN